MKWILNKKYYKKNHRNNYFIAFKYVLPVEAHKAN